MLYPHNLELAAKYFKQVELQLAKYALAATPNNYEVWYNYVAEENLNIVHAIDAFLRDGKGVSEAQCHELYAKYLADNKTEEHVRRAGDELRNTIKTVKDAVHNVRTSTQDYTASLQDISVRLADNPTTEIVKSIVTTAQQNTKKIIEHNNSLEEALESSASEIERLRHDLEQVRRESLTDSLTGLSNRKSFDSEIRRILEESKKNGAAFSLLILDIDHFKSFNDNYGHQVGDQVLRLVAKCLTDGVKGKDLAARYGGEEFVIILPDTELAGAVAAGNNLRKIVANKDVINRNTGGKMGRITMSVGVAEFSGSESVEDLIERADSALYTAKHNGRNQVAAAPTPKS